MHEQIIDAEYLTYCPIEPKVKKRRFRPTKNQVAAAKPIDDEDSEFERHTNLTVKEFYRYHQHLKPSKPDLNRTKKNLPVIDELSSEVIRLDIDPKIERLYEIPIRHGDNANKDNPIPFLYFLYCHVLVLGAELATMVLLAGDFHESHNFPGVTKNIMEGKLLPKLLEVHHLLAPLGTNRKKVEFFVDSLLRREYCRDKEFPKYQADGDNSDDDGNHTVTNQAQKLEEDDYDLYFGVYAPVDK